MIPKFHFPQEIHLQKAPLIEAWLEIRWKLEDNVDLGFPNILQDRHFPFALGVFYNKIKDAFTYNEPLVTSSAPNELLPYVVRHRFWADKNTWPVIQLGPGICTLNFTSPYTWEMFNSKAIYVRENLLSAYSDIDLTTEMLALRYRNVIPVSDNTQSVLTRLKEKLNVSITPPLHIPGQVGVNSWPKDMHLLLTYELSSPRSLGSLRLATGTQTLTDSINGNVTQSPVLMFELEVLSDNVNSPKLSDETEFTSWLSSAHAVAHEWFFALIDGPLRTSYED